MQSSPTYAQQGQRKPAEHSSSNPNNITAESDTLRSDNLNDTLRTSYDREGYTSHTTQQNQSELTEDNQNRPKAILISSPSNRTIQAILATTILTDLNMIGTSGATRALPRQARLNVVSKV